MCVETWISCELEAPSEREIAGRIERVLARAPWLVAEEDGECLGYAYAAAFRDRPAYAWAMETSVYVAARHRRRGVARALYEALLELLRRQGYVAAIAGIAVPNEGSVALHESLGFRPAGTLDQVGFKLGRWIAVGYWRLRLQDPAHPPPPPRPLAELGAIDAPLWEAARGIRDRR